MESTTAKPRGKKLVRVHQEYIDCLLKEPHHKVFVGVPEELIDRVPNTELREELRTVQASARAHLQMLVDKDLDVLNQYRTKGFAEVEVHIYNDDE